MNRAEASQKLGDDSENNFFVISDYKGYTPIRADRRQNKYEHWDIRIYIKDKWVRVDVKAPKDKRFDITYLEIIGITGKNGWLLGKADYIAFQQEGHFIYFKRRDLLNWFFKKIGLNSINEIREIYNKTFDKEGKPLYDDLDLSYSNDDYFVDKKSDSLYKLYSRSPWNGNARHDVMTMVKIEDMKNDLNYWEYKL
tara:strand:+ start:3055 stop:3642 length:588 start_codon:yes stop_codon:yes gene_type:complete